MKKLLLVSITSFLASLAGLNAAVTFTGFNVTGSSNGPNGIPLLSDAGVPLAAGSAFFSIGKFTGVPDWANANVTTILSMFTPVDATPAGIGNVRPGIFNATDYSSATNVYPNGFKGEVGYIVVANNVNFALATALTVFSTGTVFPQQDGANNATYNLGLTSATTSVKYGKVVDMAPGANQPNPATVNPYLKGVQLVNVPEASTALLGALGALGLLRRRR